jgi:hypothetical protein
VTIIKTGVKKQDETAGHGLAGQEAGKGERKSYPYPSITMYVCVYACARVQSQCTISCTTFQEHILGVEEDQEAFKCGWVHRLPKKQYTYSNQVK